MATLNINCGHCGRAVAAEVLVSRSGWHALLCPSCAKISSYGPFAAQYPAFNPYGSVEHLPEDVDQAWNEARLSYEASAFTSAEIMCRKILMHLAVDLCGSDAGKSFVQYVYDIDTAGYVAPGLRPKVDEIRTRGNAANHELPASTKEDADKTMGVTRHLLVTMYELPNS